MTRKRANGEGSIYLRWDGRYGASATVRTPAGLAKRIQVAGKTRAEARQNLAKRESEIEKGLSSQGRSTKLADYLDYWLREHVRRKQKPKTYEQYESASRRELKPGLGGYTLGALTVPIVQDFLDKLLEKHSVRKVQTVRTALSAALTRAMREEILERNVARLVELPPYERAPVQPWSEDEARHFRMAAEGRELYAAFLLLLTYGMRRGEVLGLRWQDVDFEKERICIRQQLQRVGRELLVGSVKTKSGERDLPLTSRVRAALERHREQQDRARREAGDAWAGSGDRDELVFTTRSGKPIEPRNFVRSFWRICRANDIRVIKLHHIRHTAATIMKNAGVPRRDVQLILGHASSWLTEQIYQHDDMSCRVDAIEKLEERA